TRVDVTEGDLTAIGLRGCRATVAGRRVAEDAERQVVVAALGVGIGGPAVGREVQGGGVAADAAIEVDVAGQPAGLDHVPNVVAGVDVAEGDPAAVRLGRRRAAIASVRVAEDADRQVAIATPGVGVRGA